MASPPHATAAKAGNSEESAAGRLSKASLARLTFATSDLDASTRGDVGRFQVAARAARHRPGAVLPVVPSFCAIGRQHRRGDARQPAQHPLRRPGQGLRHHFGPPRTSGGSHLVFKTPWPGDPRVNIQNDHGMAKAYQVRQVLAAIERKETGS